ncbi:MAG: glycosyltransferase family 4 protein [Candidatus Pacebacteria bacterium]|nr:glycosyltransferase family 4 protein [Candidatus Paceibacterota bacterium]
MKIAIIGQKGIPAKSGGVEKHVEDLALSLVKNNQEVLVYNRKNYNQEKIKNYQGVKIISLPSLNSKYFDAILHTFISIIHLWFIKVDVIHLHSIGPGFLVWLIKLLKPKTPVIFTFHCQDYKHQKWGAFARWFLKLGEKTAIKLADEVIAVSHSLTYYAKNKYKKEINYIPNSVNLPKKQEVKIIQEKWGLEENQYITAITRLVKHKGVHYLIKAFKDIDTNKKLVIAGGGAYTNDYVNYLHELAAGQDNIIFTGSLSGDALKELFSNAYIFVQPSEEEGLSIGLLEAMSYKNACLVSNIEANLEAIGKAGKTFANRSIESLKQELKYMLENQETTEDLKEQAYQRIKEKFLWENNIKKIIKVYSQAIDK